MSASSSSKVCQRIAEIFGIVSAISERQFSLGELKFWLVTMTRQTNGFDCGTCSCIVAERIFTCDDSVLKFDSNSDRNHLRNVILEKTALDSASKDFRGSKEAFAGIKGLNSTEFTVRRMSYSKLFKLIV